MHPPPMQVAIVSQLPRERAALTDACVLPRLLEAFGGSHSEELLLAVTQALRTACRSVHSMA